MVLDQATPSANRNSGGTSLVRPPRCAYDAEADGWSPAAFHAKVRAAAGSCGQV